MDTARQNQFAVQLARPREELSQRLLAHMSAPEVRLSRTFKARGALLERSLQANHRAVNSDGPYLEAWKRYSGVVWIHVDPATLRATQRQRILIPSAFYGVTTANDDIADYRLSMNTSLRDLGVVSTFWRETVTEALRPHCDGASVVNLLTREYAAAVNFDLLAESCRIVNIRFVSSDELNAVGHDAKAVKGFLARAILQGGLASAYDFAWMGWRTVRDGRDVVVIAPEQREMDFNARRR